MGFLEEMIDLLKHTGNIKTVENITYDYLILCVKYNTFMLK